MHSGSSEMRAVMSVAKGSPASKAGIAAGDEFLIQRPAYSKNQDLRLDGVIHVGQPRSAREHRNSPLGPKTDACRCAVPGCSIPIRLTIERSPNAFTDDRQIVSATCWTWRGQTTNWRPYSDMNLYTSRWVICPRGRRTRWPGQSEPLLIRILPPGSRHRRRFHARLRHGRRACALHRFWAGSGLCRGLLCRTRACDLSAAERIWRTTAQENPRIMVRAGLHPSSPERLLLLQKRKLPKRRGAALRWFRRHNRTRLLRLIRDRSRNLGRHTGALHLQRDALATSSPQRFSFFFR